MENINYEYPLHVLFDEVAAWGREKNINDEVMQYAKINEEVGELAHELTRGRCGDGKETVPSEETIDAIGDILVTVIIFADIIGVDPRGALEEAYNTIKDRKGHTEHGSFIKDDQTGKGE
jgi:NTP pyrophosphatase (non-canonical NTP hydrolase)